MNNLPVIPSCTLLSAMLMFSVNLTGYQMADWSWTNIVFSGGILFLVVSYICMILKNIHFAWLQLTGTLMSLLYLLPLFFRLFFAISGGQKEYWMTFITVCIILLLLSIVSWKSFKIIDEKQEES